MIPLPAPAVATKVEIVTLDLQAEGQAAVKKRATQATHLEALNDNTIWLAAEYGDDEFTALHVQHRFR